MDPRESSWDDQHHGVQAGAASPVGELNEGAAQVCAAIRRDGSVAHEIVGDLDAGRIVCVRRSKRER